MWAVIPVKNLNEAKHRLESVLNPIQRRNLFAAMLEDVLATVMAVPEFEQVAVATICPTAAEIARRNGASVLSTVQDEGQTKAVARTAATLEENGIKHMLMLPGDVPLVTVEEIQTVLEVHGNAPTMTIVPARDEQGSNCIALPTDSSPFTFWSKQLLPSFGNSKENGAYLEHP